MKYVEKYRKIVDELVEKSFPELKGKRIKLVIERLKVGSMFAFKRRGYFEIKLDPIRNNLNNSSLLVGAFVHELVHFKNYSGFFGDARLLLENIAFGFSRINKVPMAFFERGADKETIRRGYARELYKNRKFRLKNSPKAYWDRWSFCYLSLEEIKAYAKEIGKW